MLWATTSRCIGSFCLTLNCLIVLHRVGPYHHARFVAAAQLGLNLTVLQTRPQSDEYPWSFKQSGPFSVVNLEGSVHAEADAPSFKLDQQLNSLIYQIQPDAIVSVGWADRAYQRLLLASYRHRIPTVIISDSRQCDEQRFPHKEWIKRQLVFGYSSSLVAGTQSREYLEKLGFPKMAIFKPWDVVDNDFFSTLPSSISSRCKKFLCVSRFVSKKNHSGLLKAFAIYQEEGGNWGLHLVGGGPLENEIRADIANLPDPTKVQCLPFCQLEELRGFYCSASAFILPSTTDQWGLVVNEAIASGLPCLVSRSCGCAVDLINHGVTGWIFDPNDPVKLASMMRIAEHQTDDQRRTLISAARHRLSNFTLSAFAVGLQKSVQWAICNPRFSRRAAIIAHLLSYRP